MRKRGIRVFFTKLAGVLATLMILTTVSCKDEDAPVNDNTYVNDWIFENMQYWYLWKGELPGSPDKNTDPATFFDGLLSSQDRFSWIQENYIDLLNSLNGINREAGFEFRLYRESESSDNVIAQILYIKPGSPAEDAGLNRGDVIKRINGQQITMTNYQSLLEALDENYSITYTPFLVETQDFGTESTITLQPVEYHENPVYMDSVYSVGDRQIGYFIYNFFANGTEDDASQYNNEMDAVFAKFKSKNITDLVIDLRFNSGGSETAATNLASLIASGTNGASVFAKREYNETVQQDILNDPSLGTDFLITRFVNKAGNVGSQLTGNRVYVLTSDRTASASELVINGLKPFMEVFLIGDVTYGKNVGSISIYEENNARNTWGMQPIVVKVYNSLNQSDYSSGFTPDVENEDNDLHVYPLGDVRESMLGDALDAITGGFDGGRLTRSQRLRKPVGHSLDFKRSSYTLIIDSKVK